MKHKQKQYINTRLFERLIAEIEQSLSHMADDDLERIIFLCWVEQQSRCSEPSQQGRCQEGEHK